MAVKVERWSLVFRRQKSIDAICAHRETSPRISGLHVNLCTESPQVGRIPDELDAISNTLLIPQQDRPALEILALPWWSRERRSVCGQRLVKPPKFVDVPGFTKLSRCQPRQCKVARPCKAWPIG